ncbi:MAG: lipid II flippase MurJ [Planctomycetota bacterium]
MQPSGAIAAPAAARSLGDRILKAGVSVLAANLCVRLAGFFIKNFVPNFFGLAVSDVFSVVNDTVLNSAFVVGEQCLGPAYMPVFTSARDKEGEQRAWRYTSVLFNLQFIILLAVTAALILFPGPIIGLFTKWDLRVRVETTQGQEIVGHAVDVEPVLLTVESSRGTIRLRRDEITVWNIKDKDLYDPAKLREHPPQVRLATSQGAVEGNLVEVSYAFTIRGAHGDVRVREDEVQDVQFLSRANEEHAKTLPVSVVHRRNMAAAMLPYVAPALLGMSLASLTYWVLMGYKKFFFAAFGDALLKFSILGGAVLGGVLGRGNWHFIAWGCVAGGTLKFLLHLTVLGPGRLRLYRPTLDLRDKYLRDFCLLVLPLLAGILLSLVRDVLMKRLLTEESGLPTYFAQGRGVAETVGFLVPFALSIALLPFFCDIAARDDRAQLGRLLTQTIRMVVWFFVPVCVVLAVAALPVCLVLYKGQNIGLAEASYAALGMQLFCIPIPFLAVEMLVNQAFFSSRRMIAPVVAGAVFSLLVPTVAYSLIAGFKISGITNILLLVSLCLVLARVLKSFILITLLKWTVPVLPLAETAAYALRLLLAGGGAAMAALGTQKLYAGPLHFLDKAVHSARLSNACEAVLIGLAGAAVYLALSLLFKLEEPRLCWQWTREKLRRRGTGDKGPGARGEGRGTSSSES